MNIVVFFIFFILFSPKIVSSWNEKEHLQLKDVIQEASAELDFFIENISSFIIYNILSDIRTFTGSRKIKIEFWKYSTIKVEEVNKRDVLKNLYTKSQYNILKEFHNDIGNYLKKNLGSGLTWNVNVYFYYIVVEITYNTDFNAIKYFSKKLKKVVSRPIKVAINGKVIIKPTIRGMENMSTTEIEANIKEASVQLDLLIDNFSSFLSNRILSNIQTLTPPEIIIIVFRQDFCNQQGLYVNNGFNILKIFHNEIGKYLEKKFEHVGLKWNVYIELPTINVEIIYHIDFSAVTKYSKKLN
ncbi:hypothetical protein RhiirA4_538085 [Rhizophagus irregularis]|uniref:Uncharacterized protein n=1 Tax=Rhizophagus irregularis TaxID=588596 RepID=A0A2I1FYF3_9GLOM|nr:hypothetical protein RhiirA4_538085 [Rhizophagus irregularis]